MMKLQKLFLFIVFLSGIFTPAWSQPCLPNTNSLDFNGISSNVRINSLAGLDITTQLTIEAWINPNQFAASTTGNSIFCKHSWGSSMYGYVLRCGGSGQLSFNIAGVSGSPVGWKEVISPAGALLLDTWQHVAGVFDGTVMKIYINGQPAGSLSFAGTIAVSSGIKPRIGALADTTWGMSRYFSGMIDEVRVWNRALAQNEIVAGMNDHLDPSLQTGLVGYWRLNDGSGNLVADLGTGNNSGTVINAVWSTQVPFNSTPPPVPTVTYSAGMLHSSASDHNQWYFNGTLISGATQQTYTPTNYGDYSVEVTDTVTGCSSMSANFYYNTTGIADLQGQNIMILGNPVHDFLTFSVPFEEAFQYEVRSLTGQILMEGMLNPAGTAVISLDPLPQGVYLLRCHNDVRSFSEKFLVQ